VTASSTQAKRYTQKRGRSVRQRTLTKGQSAPRAGDGWWMLYGPEMPQNRWYFSRAVLLLAGRDRAREKDPPTVA